MPPAPRRSRPDLRLRAAACAAALAGALAAGCSGPRLQVVVSPKAFPLEAPAARPAAPEDRPDRPIAAAPPAPVAPSAPAVAPAADPLRVHVATSVVRLEAPRWQSAPVEGRLIEARADSLWILPAAGASPVGVPRGCVTALAVWRPGSSAASMSRTAFFGTLIGGAVGLFVNPNPTGWQVRSAAYAVPATAAGAMIGAAIGWSRPGGRWDAAAHVADAGTPPCAPKPAAKPRPKPPVKR